MVFPQLGHIDRGWTIDFEMGSRYMQTFKKLPIKVPKIKANICGR
jgi:IS1 family transposase